MVCKEGYGEESVGVRFVRLPNVSAEWIRRRIREQSGSSRLVAVPLTA